MHLEGSKKSPLEVKVLTERWCREYNTVRPHSALGYKLPVPETVEFSLPKMYV